MTTYLTRPVEILHVEDNELDAEDLERSLAKTDLKKNLHRVEDGAEALAFLHREGRFQNAPRPDLVLLDLNMPGVDGHQVLKHIREEPDLCTIPVVILTTSSSMVDITRAYAGFANGFLTKPFDESTTMVTIGALIKFWFSIVRLPPKPGEPPIQPNESICRLPSPSPLEILYVEDNKVDASTMATTAAGLGFRKPIRVVETAEEALSFLNREGQYAKAPRPDLLILDMYLPGISGLESLKTVRLNQLEYRFPQVILFTGEGDDEMVLEAYRAHVNAFVPKPRTAKEWEQTLCAIGHWWSVVRTCTKS